MEDQLDIGESPLKEWVEFRVSFAGTLLNLWLLKDMEELEPNYAEKLQNRLETARDIAEVMFEGEELSYPIPSILEGSVNYEWWDSKSYEELWKQLFPHDLRDGEADFRLTSKRLVVVGLHSALESFCTGSGVHGHGNLPISIKNWFKRRDASESLPAEILDHLRDLDATRHLIIHNRGIVNEKFIKNVPSTELVAGEIRPLRFTDLHEYADAVWSACRLITLVRWVERQDRTGA